jgi:hypothetical protein
LAATVDLTTGTATGPAVGQDLIVGIENLSAGSERVVFIGHSGLNRLWGNEGRDRIRARAATMCWAATSYRIDSMAGLERTPAMGVITNCEHILS